MQLCREKLAGADNVEYRITDGSRLPNVADDSVDFIWSFDVFVHISPEDQQGYMSEFARVMRPGAKAVIHHAGVGGLHGDMRSAMTREMFADLVQANGLTLVDQFERWGPTAATSSGHRRRGQHLRALAQPPHRLSFRPRSRMEPRPSASGPPAARPLPAPCRASPSIPRSSRALARWRRRAARHPGRRPARAALAAAMPNLASGQGGLAWRAWGRVRPAAGADLHRRPVAIRLPSSPRRSTRRSRAGISRICTSSSSGVVAGSGFRMTRSRPSWSGRTTPAEGRPRGRARRGVRLRLRPRRQLAPPLPRRAEKADPLGGVRHRARGGRWRSGAGGGSPTSTAAQLR